MLASKIELDTSAQCYCNFYPDTLRDVLTVIVDILTLESRHVMQLVWVPSLIWIQLTVPKSGLLKFCHWPPA